MPAENSADILNLNRYAAKRNTTFRFTIFKNAPTFLMQGGSHLTSDICFML